MRPLSFKRHRFPPDVIRYAVWLARFDLSSGAVQWMSGKDRHALIGIDGLYCQGHALLAVQNGASPPRVVSFALAQDRAEIIGETLISRSEAGDFTHGVPVGDAFFFLTHAAWNAIDDAGTLKPGASPAPVISSYGQKTGKAGAVRNSR